MRWRQLTNDGVRLFVRDWGGNGRPVLLLHGLAGQAREWDATAHVLAGRWRVLALDQRGHGRSERQPADVSRAAYVGDAVAVAEGLCDEPVTVIGQSLGGHTAFLVAATRPDLTASVVVAEATAGGPDRGGPQRVRRWLESWPAPFRSRREALEYFGGDNLAGRAWVSGLQWTGSGWSPRFDIEVMTAALGAATERSWWDEWARVRCPALVVRGDRGWLAEEDALEMARAVPHARAVTVDAAGYDVHLDQAVAWQHALESFLCSLNETSIGHLQPPH